MNDSLIYVIIGPSGAGKTTCLNSLKKAGFPVVHSITTRKPRPSEKNGSEYFFMSAAEFCERKDIILKSTSNNTYYGCFQGALLFPHPVFMILDPTGVIELEKLTNPKRIRMFEFQISKETAAQRMVFRGDDPAQIIKSFQKDKIRFSTKLMKQIKSQRILIDANKSQAEIFNQVLSVYENKNMCSLTKQQTIKIDR